MSAAPDGLQECSNGGGYRYGMNRLSSSARDALANVKLNFKLLADEARHAFTAHHLVNIICSLSFYILKSNLSLCNIVFPKNTECGITLVCISYMVHFLYSIVVFIIYVYVHMCYLFY